jgi:hypothetical protein
MREELDRLKAPRPALAARMIARGMALEKAAQALGPGALPVEILDLADRFYPFIAQEIDDR